MRDGDMVPTVRQVLESLQGREGIVFPRAEGGIFSRDTMYDAWQERWRRRVFVGSGPTTYATRSPAF